MNEPVHFRVGYILVMKGAPERITDLCSTILVNNRTKNFDADARDDYNRAYLVIILTKLLKNKTKI
jgi:magnesium-transporting ATPase (P-type)